MRLQRLRLEGAPTKSATLRVRCVGGSPLREQTYLLGLAFARLGLNDRPPPRMADFVSARGIAPQTPESRLRRRSTAWAVVGCLAPPEADLRSHWGGRLRSGLRLPTCPDVAIGRPLRGGLGDVGSPVRLPAERKAKAQCCYRISLSQSLELIDTEAIFVSLAA